MHSLSLEQAIKWLDRSRLARQGAFVRAKSEGSTALSPMQLVANDVIATGSGLLDPSKVVPALEVIGDGGRDMFIGELVAAPANLFQPLDRHALAD